MENISVAANHHQHNHDHHHHHVVSSHRILFPVLALTLGYALVEAIAGWWAGSLALLGDAAHMLTDSLALGLASVAAWLSLRPPSPRHTYGLGRAESLAALFNALFMIGLVSFICAEAVNRLLAPQPVHGATVTGVAFVGLLINLAAAWLLAGGRENLNVRAALLHVIGDLLGSVAALISGVVILYTGWTRIDPILSFVISALILISSVQVLREALRHMMEGVPLHLSLESIGHAMAEIGGVQSVHDLHVWSISANRAALSAHVVVDDLSVWNDVLAKLRGLLQERFAIDHVTLQPETCIQTIDFKTFKEALLRDI
jgi:cobalt-zinc-cadmium efflux system protein